MPKTKYGNRVGDEVREKVFEVIRRHSGGISRKSVQKQLGVNPHDEQDRTMIFRVAAALDALQREKHVVSDVDGYGTRWYYPQSA